MPRRCGIGNRACATMKQASALTLHHGRGRGKTKTNTRPTDAPAVRRQNARCAGPQCTCGTRVHTRVLEGCRRRGRSMQFDCIRRSNGNRVVCVIAIQKETSNDRQVPQGTPLVLHSQRLWPCAFSSWPSNRVLSRPTRWIDDHVSCAPARVRTRVLQHCTMHAAGARMLVQPAAAGRISWRCVHERTLAVRAHIHVPARRGF